MFWHILDSLHVKGIPLPTAWQAALIINSKLEERSENRANLWLAPLLGDIAMLWRIYSNNPHEFMAALEARLI